MTGNEVHALQVQIAEFRATVVGQLAALAADNVRGEAVHVDHEQRIRSIESANVDTHEPRIAALETAVSEGRGAWKLVTAGGAGGALIVAIAAAALHALGV